MEQTDGILTLDLPESEAGFLRSRRLVVALTPESLALHPDAEALVPGSDLLARHTAAIRARAGRWHPRGVRVVCTAGTCRSPCSRS